MITIVAGVEELCDSTTGIELADTITGVVDVSTIDEGKITE